MSLNKTHIIIRADATPRIGTGHVMRCLALAQAANSNGFSVSFVSRLHVAWVQERLKHESFPLLQIQNEAPLEEQPSELLAQIQTNGLPAPQKETNFTWVVLDGYHFGPECQKRVQAAGYKLLVVDDYNHFPEYHCDILLNQNINAGDFAYKGNIGKKYLGLDYVLLRQEFIDARDKALLRTFPNTPQTILITLGGGNCIEYLEKIAQDFTIPELTGRVIRIIQGEMNSERIEAAFRNCPASIEILPSVENMTSLLLKADLCITAGGSTCWELLCLNVPFLTIQVAENQRALVSYLDKNKICTPYTLNNFRRHLLSHIPLRFSFNRGKINELFSAMKNQVQLKKVTLKDIKFIYDIANQQSVRAASLSCSPISFEEHQSWFTTMLEKDIPFFLVYYNEDVVGYIRCSSNGPTTTISIALDESARGKGIATKALARAHDILFTTNGIETIQAVVKKKNIASLRLFQKANYMPISNNDELIFLQFEKHAKHYE